MNYVHAHADALSFEYASNGVTWMVDPGTYTYTKDPELRDQFRSSSAHNTLIVEGQSQSQASGPFSWAQVAETTLQELTATAEAATCRGVHNGYERFNPPVRHQRSIQLIKRSDRPASSYLLIEDRITTAGSYRYQLRFHLAPDCKPSQGNARFVVHHPDGPQLAVGIWLVDPQRAGTPLPIGVEEGWVSPDYARKLPAPILVANAEAFAGGVERLEINVWGLPYALAQFKYQVKCLQLLRSKFAALDIENRNALRPVLDRTGCWKPLTAS